MHSPGPWQWHPEHSGQSLRYGDGSDESLVLEIYVSHGGGMEPNEADARLIAAAPDLLAALKALIADVEDGDRPWAEGASAESSEMHTARAAVAKAQPTDPE